MPVIKATAYLYSSCPQCDSLMASCVAHLEEGLAVHLSMARDDPDHEHYMKPMEWEVAFAQTIYLAHARECPIWHAEHQQEVFKISV